MMQPEKGNKAIIIFLLFFSVVFLLPLLVSLTNSLMPEAEIQMNYTDKRSVFDVLDQIQEKFIRFRFIPGRITLSQYKEVLINQPSFLALLLNSAKITLPVVVGNIVFSLLSAYGFTIWQWRCKEAVFFIYILVMLMPLQAVLVPNYIIADFLNIRDSYLAIILPGIFSPFGAFLLRQQMKHIPPAYLEAAKIDGAGVCQTFFHVVLPQMKSGIAALAMLIFIDYWNVVEQAVIFIKDYTREPLSVYLSRLVEGQTGLAFAASCVYMLFPFWMLVLGQKHLEKGIEMSGVK